MDESLYQLVLSHYQKGNYENAYHIFNDYLQTHENGLSQKENLLYEECKKQIQNKYLLLINEYIQQGNWELAKKTQEHYIGKFGYGSKIKAINFHKLEERGKIRSDNIRKRIKSRVFVWIVIWVIVIITIFFAFIEIDRIEHLNNPETVCENSYTVNDEYAGIKEVIDGWNYLHNSENFISRTSLECLYSSQVRFYGQLLSAYDCVTLFANILKKYDSFSQKIKGDIYFTRLTNDLVRCDFIKVVETNGKCKEYEAYLVFKLNKGCWSIIEESDKLTDMNLEKMKKKNN